MRDYIFNAYDVWHSTLIRNFAAAGIGKSQLIADLIRQHPTDNFVIVIPDHQMACGRGDLEDMLSKKGINWTHIYGKSQEHSVYGHYCLREEDERYYPSCNRYLWNEEVGEFMEKYGETYEYYEKDLKTLALCQHWDSCPYRKQFFNIDRYQVIICVLQHASLFDKRVLIFDESFEQKLLMNYTVTPDDVDEYHISLIAPYQKKIQSKEYTFYTSVQLSTPIRVNSPKAYFISNFFDSTGNIHAYIQKNGNICLFGSRINYLPNYTRMIFNCATTPLRLMRKITNTEFWEEFAPTRGGWAVYKSENINIATLKNPIFKFKSNWTKNMAHKWLEYMIEYFKMFGNDILVVTKLSMEIEFQKKFPDANFVHFNAGRGFNSIDKEEGYSVLIQYGRFGFTPLNKEMFKLIGFSDDLIDEMEWSEMMQCLHRGRPILHPNMPILLLSDKNLFPEVPTISAKVLELFYHHYDIDLTLPYKDLMQKLDVKGTNRIAEFKTFVSFVRKYIYKFKEITEDEEEIDAPLEYLIV
jgi:hypothetical protein